MKAIPLIVALIIILGIPAKSQVAEDVPKDHWAYEAVQNVATKGLIKGYPPKGNVFGGRTATRYEIATIIHRMLQQIDDIYAKKAGSQKPQPAVGTQQLAEIQKLVDEFQKELFVIGANLKKFEDELAELKEQVTDVRRTLDKTATDVALARKE